jgi:hypothetical protein
MATTNPLPQNGANLAAWTSYSTTFRWPLWLQAASQS